MELEQLGTVKLNPCKRSAGPLKTQRTIFNLPKRQKTIPGTTVPKSAIHFPNFSRKKRKHTPSNKSMPNQKENSTLEDLTNCKPNGDDAVTGRGDDDHGDGGRPSSSACQDLGKSSSSTGDFEGMDSNGIVVTPSSVAAIFRDAAPIAKDEALRPLIFKIPTDFPDANISDFEKWCLEDFGKKPLVNTILTM